MMNQYAEGVDWWGTPSRQWKYLWSVSTLFDTASSSETVDFINHYFDQTLLSGKRKRFPALFSVYLPGLDHYAHMNGMAEYPTYFKDTVDVKIKEITKALQDQDEFDNKIFIIISDHGETQMPDKLKYKERTLLVDSEGNPILSITDEKQYQFDELPVDMSCSLKTVDYGEENVQAMEKQNNSLHIWELGDALKEVGLTQNAGIRTKYKLLVPKEIEQVFVDQAIPTEYRPTSKIDAADIVVAMNGPMAHVYSRIGRDEMTLGAIASIFRLTLGGDHWEEAKLLGFNNADDYLEFQVKASHRLWNSIDSILVRKADGTYAVFEGLDAAGNPIFSNTTAFAIELYVKAADRIKAMNSPDRSGDIVLIMRDKTTEDAIQRYTTAYACKAWHGSLNNADSFVPLIVTYPGGSSSEIDRIIRKDSICKSDYSTCRENWNLPQILRGFIQEQY